jgi:hypothetical protein
MIEQGLVQLVQAHPAVSGIAAQGGFFATLPQNYTLPSWTYTVVSDSTDYLLSGPNGVGSRRIQIDCYALSAADAIRLAKAIFDQLNGYHGILPDPDATQVQGCFHSMTLDFFDVDSRTYRRMLEFEIWFV